MDDQTTTISTSDEALKNSPKSWKIRTLGNVAEKIGDGLHGTPKYSSDGQYYFVNGNNIEDGKIVIKADTKKVDKKEYIKHKKELGGNTILLSINGTIGNLAKYKNEKCILGKSAAYINVNNENDQDFIYYLMLDNRFQRDISKNANGSTIKNVSLAQLRNYKFLLPLLSEQRAIAAVLNSLDNKIELLRTQNRTLENIAQLIFKYWFVNFEFPNKNGESYKSNGGKTMDSELGEIPNGWKIGKLGEVTEVRGGTTPSTEIADYWNGNIHWTSPKDLSNSREMFLLDTEKKITEKGLSQIGSGLLPKGTLLLSSRAPIGYLAIANIPVAINQGYIALLPGSKFSTFYTYLWLKKYMREIISAANGSTFLEISKGSFKKISCVIPEEKILDDFQAVITPIFKKILLNILQIKTLSKMRDTVLPKLMKGEVRVKSLKD